MAYQSRENGVCVLTMLFTCMALGNLLGPSEFILRTGLRRCHVQNPGHWAAGLISLAVARWSADRRGGLRQGPRGLGIPNHPELSAWCRIQL